ncbi:hypothetical protein V3C99_003257 [Haemonchus contortus]
MKSPTVWILVWCGAGSRSHLLKAAEGASRRARSVHRGDLVHAVVRAQDRVTASAAAHHRVRHLARAKMLTLSLPFVIHLSLYPFDNVGELWSRVVIPLFIQTLSSVYFEVFRHCEVHKKSGGVAVEVLV